MAREENRVDPHRLDAVVLREQQEVDELVPVGSHEAVREGEVAAAAVGQRPEPLDVAHHHVEVRSDPDRLVGLLRYAVDRHDERDRQLVAHPFDAIGPLGGVRRDGDLRSGWNVEQHLQDAHGLRAEEGLASEEVGVFEVREELGELLKERVPIHLRQGRPVFAMSPDRR